MRCWRNEKESQVPNQEPRGPTTCTALGICQYESVLEKPPNISLLSNNQHSIKRLQLLSDFTIQPCLLRVLSSFSIMWKAENCRHFSSLPTPAQHQKFLVRCCTLALPHRCRSCFLHPYCLILCCTNKNLVVRFPHPLITPFPCLYKLPGLVICQDSYL